MLFSSRPFHLQRHSMHASMHVFLTLYYVALCCGKFQHIWLYICIKSYYIHLYIHLTLCTWTFCKSIHVWPRYLDATAPNGSVLDWCDLPASSCAMGWCDLLPFDVTFSELLHVVFAAHRPSLPLPEEASLLYLISVGISDGPCCQGAVDVSSTHQSFNWLSQIHAWLRWPHPRCANLRGCCGCWLNSSVVML